MIFNTERLIIRKLNFEDADLFYELMSNPNVMDPIPQKVFTREESDFTLEKLIEFEKRGADKKIWCLTEKDDDSFIGFGGLLKNDNNEDEIAYRIIERYWGKGYGKEIAKGLIDYSFENLNCEKITADVNIENLKSVKILEKFMNPGKEFYNVEDDCTDRRYELKKTSYSNELR